MSGRMVSAMCDTIFSELTEIHGEFDDDAIDLHPEPVEPWVDDCERAVVETGACAGFITDGDADRMSAVDERGRYVSPRMIATLVLKHLVEHRGEKGRVVLGVSASALTRRVAKALGCRVVMKPTGFEHIYKEALKGDVLLGVEGRTGICIPSHMIERDGLHVALILSELMAKTGKTLAQLGSQTLVSRENRLLKADGVLGHSSSFSCGRRCRQVKLPQGLFYIA